MTKTNGVYNNNWKRLLKFFFPFLFTVGLFQYIGLSLAGLDINEHAQKPNTGQSFVINIFSLTGAFVIVWLFRRYVDKESFKSIGFQKTNFANVITGLLIGFTIMLSGFFLLLFFGQIMVIGFKFHCLVRAFLNILF